MPRVLISNFQFEDELAADTAIAVPQHLLADTVQRECGWLAIANSDDLLPLSLPADLSFLKALQSRGLTPPVIVTGETGWRSAVQNGALSNTSSWKPVPWGWSQSVVVNWQRNAGGQRQRDFVPCPLDIVAAANDRLTSLQFEDLHEIAPVGVAPVTSIAEFEACIRSLAGDRLPGGQHPPGSALSPIDRGWVLKSRWGAAGRDKLRGTCSETAAGLGSHASNRRIIAWLKRRLDRDGLVIFEPWLDSIAEAGLQFEVTPAGEVVDLGIVPLISDARGGYLGSVVTGGPVTGTVVTTSPVTGGDATGSNFADSETVNSDSGSEWWQSAVTVARGAVTWLAERGYRGPVGVDAMLYRRSDGTVCLRPVQEVNARWTFGRLALGWKKLLRPGETATWLHGSCTAMDRWQTELQRQGYVAEWLPTSPSEIAGTPARRISVLVIGTDETARALRRVLLTPETPAETV